MHYIPTSQVTDCFLILNNGYHFRRGALGVPSNCATVVLIALTNVLVSESQLLPLI